jgi:transposase
MARNWSAQVRPEPTTETPTYKLARQLRPAEVDELVAGYQAGASVRRLATQFNLHTQTVSRRLRARGVDTAQQAALQPKEIQDAAALYQQGMSLAELGNRYDVDADTVRRRLHKLGVTMRKPGRYRT